MRSGTSEGWRGSPLPVISLRQPHLRSQRQRAGALQDASRGSAVIGVAPAFWSAVALHRFFIAHETHIQFQPPLPRSSTPNCHWPVLAHGHQLGLCRGARPSRLLFPASRPPSSRRDNWKLARHAVSGSRHKTKSVLKGRRNPSSFQDGQIYRIHYQPLRSWLISIASLRDSAAFAFFVRQKFNRPLPRSSTPNCHYPGSSRRCPLPTANYLEPSISLYMAAFRLGDCLA